MLIRSAQGMGLHRDGEHFHLPALECEIRRRLWYQILGYDARVGEDHGLSTGGFGGFCDTKLPLNVDDRDLCPNMKVSPASKPQWTDMTMFLVVTEMKQAFQEVSQLSSAVLNESDKRTSLEQLLRVTRARMKNRYLQHCDANIPIQKSTLLLGRVLMGKLEVLVRLQDFRGLNAEESAARASEGTLSLACETIEMGNELKTDELLNNFHWLFSAYTQYHLLTYVLWHLCIRPDEHCASQAWEMVDKSFSLVEDPCRPSPGSKWNVLRKLREKALDIRYSFASTSNATNDVQVDESSVPALGDGMVWDLDSIYFPDLAPSEFWNRGIM